jgi:hypothetical protein
MAAFGGHSQVIDIDTLLQPFSRRQLVEQHWDRTPLHIPGKPDKLQELGFDLDVFFRLCLQIPQLRAAYFDEQGKHREVSITGDQARSLYESGMTICAPRINNVHGAINDYARELKRALSLPGPVWANCYLSPSGKGFGLHFDDRSAFVMQIEGSKRWWYSTAPAMIAPPQNAVAHVLDYVRASYPWIQVEPPSESDLEQQLLSPGDIFYMPAGTWHRAEAGEHSLALTFGFPSASFMDLLRPLMERQLDPDDDWRRRVPALADAGVDSRLRQFFSARIAQLKSWVASLDGEALITEWQKSVNDNAQSASDTQKRAIERSERLVVPYQPTCSLEDDRLIVSCQGSAFAAPPDLRLFVERLAAQKTFVAEEAIGWCEANEVLDWSDVAEALETLLEAGIIRRQPGA